MLQELPPLLNDLADLITPLPPRLSALTARTDAVMDHGWFRQMVQDILPDQADSILQTNDPLLELNSFAHHFEQAYFPINEALFDAEVLNCSDEDDMSPWGQLRNVLPWGVGGIDPDELDSLWENLSPGDAMLATTCAVNPDRAMSGIRTTWLLQAAEVVPQSTLELLPPGGYSQEDLAQAVAGTWAQGLHDTFIWINACSDNEFIDAAPTQDWPCYSDEWDRQHLADISLLWQEAQQSMQSRLQLVSLMEENLPARTLELVTFVNSRLNPPSPDPEVTP